MKKFKLAFCTLLVAFLVVGAGFSGIKTTKYNNTGLTSAKSMCVLEGANNTVLLGKDMNTKRANASTTKIATAITVIENCKNLDEIITVSDNSIGVEGTSIYLRKDEQISVRDLLYGLMLRSGNDSAVALAMHVAGTMQDFISLMNEMCVKVGALNTHFNNPHGLDDENHYTTAYDLALITSYALNNSTFAEIVACKQHIIPKTNMSDTRYLTNKNKLLNSLNDCIGVKTGFTTRAGRCLVSAIRREGVVVVCVVLNCGPMFEDSVALLNSVFEQYDFSPIVIKGEPIYNEYYIDNIRGELLLCSDETYIYPVLKGNRDKIKVVYTLNKFESDVKEGDVVGEISVFYDNHLQKTLKLYTINKIDVLENQDVFNSIKLQWEK